MAKMKGEPPNRSNNYNDVFTPGQVQEGGSLGYAIANLLRGLARSQAGKTATKSQFPKSNVKVVKKPVKKTAVKKQAPIKKAPAKKRPAGPDRPTPEQFRKSQREQIKWWEQVESRGKAPGGIKKIAKAPAKKKSNA